VSELRDERAPRKLKVDMRAVDERALLEAVLRGSEDGWREFVRRFSDPLRALVRESTDAIHPMSQAEIEDVLGDFWVRLVDADMRCLRRFRGGSASILAFLGFQVLEVAHEHVRRLRDEPPTAPLRAARNVVDPRAAPNDMTGLSALLQLPVDVQALRREVAQLRSAVDQLRRALPPVLLSVSEAARALNVSTVTIRRMIRAGTLAHVRVGRSLRVDLTRTPVESTNVEDGIRAAAILGRR
jgi:excisionase family DNA binding protein